MFSIFIKFIDDYQTKKVDIDWKIYVWTFSIIFCPFFEIIAKLKNSSDSSIDDERFEDQDAGPKNDQSQSANDGNTLPMANGKRSVNEI